jgi:hypothetical protein
MVAQFSGQTPVALSATCGATRRRQMRDVRYDRDASSDDQNQRKDYSYLFYNRVASFAPNVARTSKVP